jgi:hypothetical protein
MQLPWERQSRGTMPRSSYEAVLRPPNIVLMISSGQDGSGAAGHLRTARRAPLSSPDIGRPVEAGAGQEPDAPLLDARCHPVAVELNLVGPLRAARRFRRELPKLRLDPSGQWHERRDQTRATPDGE